MKEGQAGRHGGKRGGIRRAGGWRWSGPGARRQSAAPETPEATEVDVDALASFLHEGRRVLALTGAGVSTEYPSAIPDYRSPNGAYAKGYKPMTHQVWFERGLGAGALCGRMRYVCIVCVCVRVAGFFKVGPGKTTLLVAVVCRVCPV